MKSGEEIVVFAPDVRLRGELQIKWDLNSVIWGRPEVGVAAHDVKRAVEYLSQRSDVDRRKIFCIGLGEMGVAAPVSGAFDNRIAAIAADDLGKTYRAGRERPLMPRLLRYGDLPHIAATLAPRPLWLNRAEPANEFEFLRKAYAAADKSNMLLLPNLPTAAAKKTMVGWLESLSNWTFAFHAIPASQRQLSIAWDIPVATPVVILSTGVTPTVPAGGSSRPKERGGL
jgi:hypothetical protein